MRLFHSFYHFGNLVLVSFAALALNATGCAAPTAEEEEEEGSTESSNDGSMTEYGTCRSGWCRQCPGGTNTD